MCGMNKRFLIALFLTMHTLCAWAEAQDHQLLRDAVSAFISRETAATPGKVSFQIGELDSRLVLAKCEKPETFLPTGSTLLGKTSIGVRCAEKNTWTIFIPVQIQTSVTLLISAHSLPVGHVLAEADLASQTMEITQTGGVMDKQTVLGKTLKVSIGAGQVLREDMLRAPFCVSQGQTVQLITQGDRFVVRSSGVALSNASEGQMVKIRNNADKVVSGLARISGVVEIMP